MAIMPPPAGDNYKATKRIWGIFKPTLTLALDLLTPEFKSLPQNPSVAKVWSNSIN